MGKHDKGKKKLLDLDKKIEQLKKEKYQAEEQFKEEIYVEIYNLFKELDMSVKDFFNEFKRYIENINRKEEILKKERIIENEE